MTHLLDTNACVSHLRSSQSNVSRLLLSRQPGDVALCSVVKAELIYGARRSQDPTRNFEKLSRFFERFQSLPFDDEAADFYGRIRSELAVSGSLIGPNDLLIAAIALANDLTLVTHNLGEFSRVAGLKLEDWEASET